MRGLCQTNKVDFKNQKYAFFRGLGVERHFLHQLHLYSEPSFTVIVINTTPDDEIFFIEKLKQMNLNCPPKLLTADVTSKDR